MNIGDYVAVGFPNDKGKSSYCLAKVIRTSPIRVQLQPSLSGSQDEVTVTEDTIACIFGPKPAVGKVYGIDLKNIFRKSVPIGRFGTLNYYCAPEKELRKQIKDAFSSCEEILSAKKLNHVFDEVPLRYEVRHMSMAGSFSNMKDEVGLIGGVLSINPFKCNSDSLVHCILHEFGHYYFARMDEELKLKWLTAWSSYVKASQWSTKQVRQLRDTFSQSNQSFKEFSASLDEEEREVFSLIHSHVRRVFKVKEKDLELLYQQDPELVLEKFPLSVNKTVYGSLVSDYSNKNYEEFFCESFSFFLEGQKLPKSVNRLVKESILFLR